MLVKPDVRRATRPRRRQCHNLNGYPKVVYVTRERAVNAVRRLRASGGDADVHHYRCPECGHFHIGHKGTP